MAHWRHLRADWLGGVPLVFVPEMGMIGSENPLFFDGATRSAVGMTFPLPSLADEGTARVFGNKADGDLRLDMYRG